jgi:8-oxo-dGTP pyrophosphatase MutT (NUDIX family)
VAETPAPGAAIRLPDSFGARADDVLSGRLQPAAPRDAATVMLLRTSPDAGEPGGPAGAGRGAAGAAGGPGGPAGGDSGLEVYLLRRQPTMAFAPGAVVFPGGSVDPRDADSELSWAGPDPAEWGRLLGAPPQLARALVCAAVRETFEESGVLLAGPDTGSIVADTRDGDWEADRQALLDRSLSLAGLLARRRLVLRSDLLRPWARWITPVTEERRYDTRFFAAELPHGQLTRDVGGEADRVAWLAPATALAAARRHEIFLLPPTAVSLGELAACHGLDAALAARRRIAPLMPEVTVANGAVWLTVPADVEYPL